MNLINDQHKETIKLRIDLKEYYDAVLENSPPGTLTSQTKNGHEQFMHLYYEGERRIRSGITKDANMQKQLAQKEFAQRADSILSENISILENAMAEIRPFDPDKILRSMSKSYSKLPEEYFFDREKLVTDLHLPGEEKTRILRHREWGKQAFQASTYHPEWKKHRTSRGLKMRSKSEVLIMEKLYHYGIDVRYEQVWDFGDDVLAPDFTFEGEDGQLFCWEHLGMMDDPRYAADNYRKLMKYYNHGFVMGKNLIVSFDRCGTIDMKLIDFIIQNGIIPRL